MIYTPQLFYRIFLDLNSFFLENGAMFVPSLITGLLFGAITAYMSKAKGKNPYLWFFIGLFFGIFGVLFLFFSPQSRPFAKQRQKPKNDPNTIDITPQVDPKWQKCFWYFLDQENNQQGPISFDALSRSFQEGKISKNTFVWNENLEEWKPFGEVTNLP